MAEHDRWKCKECGHICRQSEVLTAPSPFADTYELVGCPHCKSAESLHAACAIEGCTKDGSCGGPGNDGVYRQTCYEHADWMKRRTPGVRVVGHSCKLDGSICESRPDRCSGCPAAGGKP